MKESSIIFSDTSFYLWLGYGAMLIFGLLGVLSLRIRVIREDGQERKQHSGRSILAALFFILFAITGWLFYRDFHAMNARADQVRLVYPWPRAAITIQTREIEQARIVPGSHRRGSPNLGYLEISANGEIYTSSRLYSVDRVHEVRAWISAWSTTRHKQGTQSSRNPL